VANHKQAIKRHKQSLDRKARNNHYKSSTRTHLKRARAAIESGERDAAAEAVGAATKLLDRVAGKGIIPANRASRLKSRLMSQLSASP
jgi:small subunit ribosomal protein S20